MLAPPCADHPDLANLSAVAMTPSGKQVQLEFDKAIANKSGSISLFFAGILTKTVPVGSIVKFEGVEAADDDSQYVEQEGLEVFEADMILPRLEKEGIRFRIDVDTSRSTPGRVRNFRDSRIGLFIHVDDVPAWQKIRADYFPV